MGFHRLVGRKLDTYLDVAITTFYRQGSLHLPVCFQEIFYQGCAPFYPSITYSAYLLQLHVNIGSRSPYSTNAAFVP